MTPLPPQDQTIDEILEDFYSAVEVFTYNKSHKIQELPKDYGHKKFIEAKTALTKYLTDKQTEAYDKGAEDQDKKWETAMEKTLRTRGEDE